jgi:hypothetical protein
MPEFAARAGRLGLNLPRQISDLRTRTRRMPQVRGCDPQFTLCGPIEHDALLRGAVSLHFVWNAG